MTEEEYFRKNYPDFCCGDRLLSPYWDFFQGGVEFGEQQSGKKIKQLEKENAELKESVTKFSEDGLAFLHSMKSNRNCIDCESKMSIQLIKAKVALRNVIDYLGQFCSDYPDCVIEAEQFLSEVGK